jgi:GNAT superfamily N-acetyltransferase
MHLRPATVTDAPMIARLHAESWRAAYRGFYRDDYLDGDIVEERLAVWRERFDPPADNQYVLLATDGGDALGFVCAYGDHDPVWGTLVDNLHVLPAHQGRGLGRRLLASAAAWSRQRYPDAGLYLWVIDGNARARRFYELLGGQPRDSEVSEPPGGGAITGVRYVWPLLDALAAYADDS